MEGPQALLSYTRPYCRMSDGVPTYSALRQSRTPQNTKCYSGTCNPKLEQIRHCGALFMYTTKPWTQHGLDAPRLVRGVSPGGIYQSFFRGCSCSSSRLRVLTRRSLPGCRSLNLKYSEKLIFR